ncbi:MAG: hypothetical protein RLZZ312_948 [Bacteroidota bacterium]|jgi:hypothetical protein
MLQFVCFDFDRTSLQIKKTNNTQLLFYYFLKNLKKSP